MDDDSEQWRSVADYEGYYQVSDHGRVRSLDRWIETVSRWGGPLRYFKPGRVLQPKMKKKATHAYQNVILSVGAKHDTRQIHRLVLETFRGPCPDGMEGCHDNGDLTDNRLANLRWDTPSANAYDRVKHGTHWQANAVECPHGHTLAAPNLDPSAKRLGFRRCHACALTTMWGRNLRHKVGSPAWIAEADRRHAEILHFGQPLNYRLAANRRPGGGRWQPVENYPSIP